MTAHGNTTLTVVYTNEESTLNETLQMYEQWLEDPNQRRSVGAISCARLELIVLFLHYYRSVNAYIQWRTFVRANLGNGPPNFGAISLISSVVKTKLMRIRNNYCY